MKILMVSSYLPYPLYSGGHIRLYNIIKNLSREHEITLVCEKRDNQTESDVAYVEKICKEVITVKRNKQWSSRSILKTVISLDPFLITGHRNSDMKKIIEDLLKTENFDLIHVETFYVMQNLPDSKADLPKLPVVLVEHNIEYTVYKKYASRAAFPLKPILALDIAKIKRIEQKFWKKADVLVAVSPKEQKIMGEGAKLIPNGVDIEKFSFKKINKNKKDPARAGQEKKVLFIGDFKWVQNRDSIVYIIKNIWPSVKSKDVNKTLKLWVVGRMIPDSIKKLHDPSIIFDENAPNQTEKIFQEADLLLSPIRIGGGTNFKILESMASGTPVLTTSLGNEGLNAEDGSEIIICEKPDEFANKIINLMEDDYLYEKLSRNGRIFIEKNFDWKNIAGKLDKIYKNL